jgi:hypothetical protein
VGFSGPISRSGRRDTQKFRRGPRADGERDEVERRE